jgi:hypothetical protein
MDFFRSAKRGRILITAIVLWFLSANFSFGQTGLGSLHGQVTDPSGAVITKATVSVMTSDGQTLSADTNSKGEYQLQSLAPDNYTVTAVANGFSTFQQQVTLAPSANHLLNIPLEIQVQQQQVQVQEQGTNVDVTAENNASSTIIRGKDLDALSDDPDQLQDDLTALAGPSAGPNGGEIYIDGFTGGTLPPKSSIREIRINQNPFSAQYDKLGYGRIEVFTKPGTDQYHGQFYVMGNDSALNTGNPFATTFPSYSSQQYSANLGGPLSKKTSFFVNADRRNIADEGIVNAFDPDSNSPTPVPFSDTVPNPKTRTNLSPRIDYQLTPNNTLTARYQYTNWNEKNDGVGQFALASQAYDDVTTHHSVQISDTQVLSTNIVNETRFEYLRDEDRKTPFSTDPTINVEQTFVSGGNQYQYETDNQNHYELQNYTSIVHGTHLVKFGARVRVETDGNSTTGGFNGSWVFRSLQAYQDGQPSQFSITTGTPYATANYADVGLYAEDGWRVRPNLSLDYGLRFETQNELHAAANFAPRVGLAWGLGRKGSTPKTILRAGYGIFYERLEIDNMASLALQNGITQTQYIVNQPDFYPNIPSIAAISSVSGVQPTVYQLAPNVRAPYVMQAAIGLERQLGRIGTVAVTYLNSRGVHQFVTINANAPLPGTYYPDDPNHPGVRPDPNAGNIYQYTSEGIFKQNQVITNTNLRIGKMFSIFGNYTLSYANANTNGIDSFASNSYNLSLDYGRAPYDVRHRLFLGGTVSLPYAFRLNPFVVVASGRPFNIVVGQDLNGDSIFNDRPSYATQGSGANVVSTPWGVFNTQPGVGYTPTATYLGDGTTLATFNLRLSKTFGFGKKLERASNNGGGFGGPGGGGGGNSRGGTGGFRGLSGAGGPGGGIGGASSNQRYSLTFSVSARNLFNRANLATPVGNLDSPIFGQANGLAGGPFASQNAMRRFDLQALFSF